MPIKNISLYNKCVSEILKFTALPPRGFYEPHVTRDQSPPRNKDKQQRRKQHSTHKHTHANTTKQHNIPPKQQQQQQQQTNKNTTTHKRYNHQICYTWQ